MSHNTTRDPRLLVAQKACALLRHSLQQKLGVKLTVPRERLMETLASAESAVMTLTYLYQGPPELAASEPMRELVAAAQRLAEGLGPVLSGAAAPPLVRANLQWCLRTLRGLGRRLGNSGRTLVAGVDLAVVEVRNVAPSGTLWRTRVSDGAAEYTVVTNLPGIRTRDTIAVAFLPPREVGGTVSEAMFLGGQKRAEKPGTLLAEEQVDAREAAAILHELVSGR